MQNEDTLGSRSYCVEQAGLLFKDSKVLLVSQGSAYKQVLNPVLVSRSKLISDVADGGFGGCTGLPTWLSVDLMKAWVDYVEQPGPQGHKSCERLAKLLQACLFAVPVP